MNRSSSLERVRLHSSRDAQSRLSMVSTAVSDGRGQSGRFDERKRDFERANEIDGRINKDERERIDDSEVQKRKDRAPGSPKLFPPPGARILNAYGNPIKASAAHLEAKMPYGNIYYGTLFLSSIVTLLT